MAAACEVRRGGDGIVQSGLRFVPVQVQIITHACLCRNKQHPVLEKGKPLFILYLIDTRAAVRVCSGLEMTITRICGGVRLSPVDCTLSHA
jgi:hypothetical protein